MINSLAVRVAFLSFVALRAPVASIAATQPDGTDLVERITISVPPGWGDVIVPRAAADAQTGVPLAVSDTLFSGQPTWFNYCSTKNAAVCGDWTDALRVDGTWSDFTLNSDCQWADLNFLHLNSAPTVMRGGRHTIIAFADYYNQQSADINPPNVHATRQFVWSPESLPATVVTSSSASPPAVSPPPALSDCIGYRFVRSNAAAFVLSEVTDLAASDVVLRLFVDPWLGSQGGYSVEGAESAHGPGEVNFVVGSGAGTPATLYPAVSGWTNGAVGGYSLSWADADGRRDSSGVGHWDGALAPSNMAGVYEVWLHAGVAFSAVLTRTSGDDDLALAIGPQTPGSYWSRDDALGNSSPVTGTLTDLLTFTPTATGWHPLVVYRGTSADRAHTQSYALQFGAGTVDVGTEATTFFLSLAGPNPVSSAARFAFSIARAGSARIEIVDSAGRRVRTLTNGTVETGPRQISWDLRDATGAPVRAGAYWARLVTGGEWRAVRFTVLR